MNVHSIVTAEADALSSRIVDSDASVRIICPPLGRGESTPTAVTDGVFFSRTNAERTLTAVRADAVPNERGPGMDITPLRGSALQSGACSAPVIA
jgi:hypothetical protein